MPLVMLLACTAVFSGSCWGAPSGLSGTWVANSGLSADYMELEQSGQQLTGIVCETLPNAPNVTTFRQVPVHGSLKGHITVRFFVTYDTGMTATFAGTLSGGAIRGDLFRNQDGNRRTLEFRPSTQSVPASCR
jgi:hypothetical protein